MMLLFNSQKRNLIYPDNQNLVDFIKPVRNDYFVIDRILENKSWNRDTALYFLTSIRAEQSILVYSFFRRGINLYEYEKDYPFIFSKVDTSSLGNIRQDISYSFEKLKELCLHSRLLVFG